MRLSQFIQENMERILVQWEAFASSMLPAAANMSPPALRDHAEQMLDATCRDLNTAQSREAQREKSLGRAPKMPEAAETAAQTHAILRAKAGFDINQLAAEYRALRASVIRLWMDHGELDESALEDIIRFNEAIDQALAESIHDFSEQVDQSRNLFFGMLGHDMRNPLQTIQMTAAHLSKLNAGDHVSEAAARLINSGARMKGLLDDLLDFNRTKLGLGINIDPAEVNGEHAVASELALIRGAHPDHEVEFQVVGDVRGYWDEARLNRMIGNLVLNAIKYGDGSAPIRVSVRSEGDIVQFVVTNTGTAINPAIVDTIFEPLRRGVSQDDTPTDSSLGLGLYIAREIAKAHGGQIHVRSDATETAFAVRLPRRANPAGPATHDNGGINFAH